MSLAMVTENGTFKCSACGGLLNAKKGQLLPPCPRCGGKLERVEAPAAGSDGCCGS